MDPTSAPFVVPIRIPSTDTIIIPITGSPNPGPYLLPSFISDTVFFPSNLLSMSPSK